MHFPPEFFAFVEANRAASPSALRLRHHGAAEEWLPLAINHIEALQKAAKKLGPLFPEVVPLVVSAEQATSAPVAQLHAELALRLVPHGARFLDMTCGIGIDFISIARALGGPSVAVELHPHLAAAATHNFRHDREVEVVNADSVAWLEAYTGPRFNLVFIDPARRSAQGRRLYNIHDCQPDVSLLTPQFAEKAEKVMVKLSPMLDVTQTLRDLPATGALHIVDEGGECRELLAILDFSTPAPLAEPQITIHASDGATLTFTPSEEAALSPAYAAPVAGNYLFEPSPSAMKAAPWGILCHRHGLRKLHPNTHLFTAPAPVDGLPGKWRLIEEVIDFSSSTAKQLAKRIAQADVATRNFPLSAPDLAKKLRIKAGGDLRLVGVTSVNGARQLLLTRK